jgi:hypothetical protein
VHTQNFDNQPGRTPVWGNPPRELYYHVQEELKDTTVMNGNKRALIDTQNCPLIFA